jgi:hypothetical protein
MGCPCKKCRRKSYKQRGGDFKKVLIDNLITNGYDPNEWAKQLHELLFKENEQYISGEERTKVIGNYLYKVIEKGTRGPRSGYEIYGSDIKWIELVSNWG